MSTTPDHPLRRRVLDAAAALYRSGGLGAVTTDALARAAGTSKRALYAHFAGRDDVIETLLQARLDHLEQALGAVLVGEATTEDRMRRFAEVALLLPLEFPPAFWGELQRLAPEVAGRVRARREAIARGALGRLLEEGVRRGELRVDLPVPLLVTVAEGLAEGLLVRDPPPGLGPRALAEAGLSVLLQGLLARPS